MGNFDFVVQNRNEEIRKVMPAVSVNNLYEGISVAQNPGLADNNWGSPHQDSYCSESVGLEGPTSERLKVIKQYNKYGFTPCMVCNSNNQMIGIAFSGVFRLIVFDSNCNILTANITGKLVKGTFGGGYFFLDNDENTIAISENSLACYPTANVEVQDEIYALERTWKSDDIVELVTGSRKNNSLYSAMPVWDDSDTMLYWCLIAGSYDFTTGELSSNAYMAVVKVEPDTSQDDGCTTTLMDSYSLDDQWNNNTFAVDEDGAYFVTNGMDSDGKNCTEGYLWSLGYDSSTGKISLRWKANYENSGYLKPGQKNIGSGTTPTLFFDSDGNNFVGITDNNYPQMNVVVYDRNDGTLCTQTGVFPNMRGCDEASLIAVNGRIVVENNFGHTLEPPRSQYVPNEPGMAMIEMTSDSGSESFDADIVWEDDRTCFFAMNMLCRESGIIFAHTGDWANDNSATEGGTYYVCAIDAWDGRVIWRIPLGIGTQYCHEYGGIYFNRDGDLFIGTDRYLISIKNYSEEQEATTL